LGKNLKFWLLICTSLFKKIKMKKIFLALYLLFNLPLFAQDITPQVVIEQYIAAIGGKAAVSAITDVMMEMEGELQGQKMTMLVQKKKPSKFYTTMVVDGFGEVNHTVFDGTKGKMTNMGQEQVIEGEEASGLKAQAEIISEMTYFKDFSQLKYAGTELVEGVKCHVIKINTLSGESTDYYEIETGMKKRQIINVNTPMGASKVTQDFSDFREVNGVKFPYKLKQDMGIMAFELIIKNIKANINPADEIFSVN
jgi:zinc protease